MPDGRSGEKVERVQVDSGPGQSTSGGADPIGDVAQPQEVARAVLFLATERHITGTILSVDGGYTAT